MEEDDYGRIITPATPSHNTFDLSTNVHVQPNVPASTRYLPAYGQPSPTYTNGMSPMATRDERLSQTVTYLEGFRSDDSLLRQKGNELATDGFPYEAQPVQREVVKRAMSIIKHRKSSQVYAD